MSVQPSRTRYREGGAGRVGRGSAGSGRRVYVTVLVALALSGCGLFDESAEEQRRLRDLELELTPMANGAEELAQRFTGIWAFYQGLLADELQEADATNLINTSLGWFESIVLSSWVQARQVASVVEERLYAGLSVSDAESHPLMAQVRWAAGLAELYMGMTFCKTFMDDEALSDTQVYRKAEQSLGLAIETARKAGTPDYLAAARAGRAQARMLLEDWDGAESDAAEVPAGFSYVSYHNESDSNPLARWIGERLVGFLHKWWPLVEESEDPGFMIDPWSGEEDRRIPVHYNGGTLVQETGTGTDVPYYRPLKYDSTEDDIPIVHYDQAQLIIAEAKAVRGDFAGATAILNRLRAAVGLPPHEVPTTAEEMEELILWERFAELHLEGQRLLDLHRKGLMEEVFEELDDPERPGVGRPSKWGYCEAG